MEGNYLGEVFDQYRRVDRGLFECGEIGADKADFVEEAEEE